ncbi:MAG: hypothetical protein AAGG51_01950 [Cyanobacteria bacterium P01_G01_bin.54]
MDIKVGGRDLEQHQLDNYVALVEASRDSNNQGLRNKLENQYNVRNGRLAGHDYLFLPSSNSNTNEVMESAYAKVRSRQGNVSVNLYFVDSQGIIYKYSKPGDVERIGTHLSD